MSFHSVLQGDPVHSEPMGLPPIRALLVDDEPIARQVLREELATFADIEIAGEAANGEEALAQIAALNPDLVLLDLQMPGLGGFDVILRLPPGRRIPGIVIVTAYDEHAIRAFEAGALDYLLKPVGRERLEKAIQRARALYGRAAERAESLARLGDIASSGAPNRRKVVGRVGEEYYLLDLDDILAFQAEREIVWIVAAKRRYLATQPLRHIDARLRGTSFQRVHRNALVNANHVRKMTPLTSQRWLLTLTNGQEFVVSKRQAGTVRQMLQW